MPEVSCKNLELLGNYFGNDVYINQEKTMVFTEDNKHIIRNRSIEDIALMLQNEKTVLVREGFEKWEMPYHEWLFSKHCFNYIKAMIIGILKTK